MSRGRLKERRTWRNELWKEASHHSSCLVRQPFAGVAVRYLISYFIPFVGLLRNYRLSDLKIDFTAGLTVALVLVPQSMANAQLAGLPAYHGLYAALVPAVVGGLWGSSRHMVTGVTAVCALMAAAAMETIPISGPGDYIAHMALLTLIVGMLQLMLGFLRMGMIVNFLSLPVISGFTNAAAIIIASSQLAKLLGVTVESAGSQAATVMAALSSAWHYTHWPSVALAGAALAVMMLLTRYAPKVPAVLVAVAVSTALSWAVGFENNTEGATAQIRSEETRRLIAHLNAEMKKEQECAAAVAECEQREAVTAVEELEREYAIRQQQLLREHTLRDIALVREHLRRTIFCAEVKANGERLFYVKKHPDAAHRVVLQASADGGRRLVDPAGASVAGSELVVVAASEGDALPAESFLDGKSWRLSIGNGPLDPDKLQFSSGGRVVGSIPEGLPRFAMPDVGVGSFLLLLPQALIIAFIGFAETISIAKTAANRFGYRIDANQELVGQGVANISGALVLTSPVAGSFSSSAVNIKAGARTGLSCVFAGMGALCVLLLFTGALYYLPQSVLAVIVMRAVGSLINFEEFRRAWTARWEDGAIGIVTFVCTLAFAPNLDYGIAVGIVLSLASYFYRSMRPNIAALSCGKEMALCDAKVFNLKECRHIAILHFQGSLFFGNTGVLEDYVLNRLETNKELRHLHLVCFAITSIDSSGEESLAMLVEKAHLAGVETSFSGVVGSVAEILERTGVLHMVGWENVFLNPREAICSIYKRIQHDAGCTDCPLNGLFCRRQELARSGVPIEPEYATESGIPGDAGEDFEASALVAQARPAGGSCCGG